jgi:hypothetical protein
MLEKALQLGKAAYGRLLTFDGERFCPAADRGDPRLANLTSAAPFRPSPSSILNRLIQGEDVVQIADLLEDDDYRTNPRFREMIDIAGYRSVLDVALRKEKALFGVIVVFRRETGVIFGQADRASAEFRGAGGHRDGKRALARRIAPAHRGSRGTEP